MTPEDIGLALLFLLVPVAVADWISVAILWRATRRNGSAIRERLGVALLLSIAVTGYFAVGINTVLGFPWFPVPVSAIINRSLLLVAGIMPLRFLWIYLRRGF
jgi:hypothetical protein